MGRRKRDISISWPEQQHDNFVITLDSTKDGKFNHNVSVNPVKAFEENSGGMVFTIDADNDVPDSYTWRFKFKTQEQIERYKLDFEEATATKWNTLGSIYRGKHTVYNRKYICKFSGSRLLPADQCKRPQSRSKNSDTGCKALLVLKIKKISTHNWEKDKYLPAYPSEFMLVGSHNHELNPLGPQRNLPVLRETKDQLRKMFDEKMSASEAQQRQRMFISENAVNPELIQDTRYLPDQRQMAYFWFKWKNESYGTNWPSLLEIIAKKYKSDPHIRVCKKNNVIAIVTPIMERVHKLNPHAKEIVFVDSTSKTDICQSTLTLILTASPIGGMPLGVIISDEKEEDSLTKGFQMLKDMTDGYGFYGNGYPQIIMTDDDQAQRNSLKNVFPLTTLLLCIFHFLQAFWRWVLTAKNGVPADKRQEVFGALKKIVYCEDEESLNSAKAIFENLETYKSNAPLREHYQDIIAQIKYWCKFYRRYLFTGGHDINNFSEATMRIMKEVILGRCRLLNAVELVEFILQDYESYHKGRISNFIAEFRSISFCREVNEKTKISQKYLPPSEVDATNISRSTGDNFNVRSQKFPGVTYEINPHDCTCSCPAGQFGLICKHLVGVHFHTDATLFSFPPITVEERIKYFEIAYGHPPPQLYFIPLNNSNNLPTFCVSNPLIMGKDKETANNKRGKHIDQQHMPCKDSILGLEGPTEEDNDDCFEHNFINCKEEPLDLDRGDCYKYNDVNCKDEPIEVDKDDDYKYDDVNCRDETLHLSKSDDYMYNHVNYKDETVEVGNDDDDYKITSFI